MSHELRTPMNAIIGYSEMLMEDAEDDGNEEVAGDLKKIHGAGTHLLSLINDVLDLSKIEAGKMDVLPRDLRDPADGRRSGGDHRRRSSRRTTTDFESRGDRSDARRDARRCDQGAPGTLQSAEQCRKVHPRGRDRPGGAQGEQSTARDWVQYSVSDSGIGIPPRRSTTCSRSSRRPTTARRATTAAPDSACRSAAASADDGRRHHVSRAPSARARPSRSELPLPWCRRSNRGLRGRTAATLQPRP